MNAAVLRRPTTLRQPLQLPLCHGVLLVPPPLQPPYLGGQHLQPSSFASVELLQSLCRRSSLEVDAQL
ncbi:hypothetical protein Fmac_012712 [Flemingia macrophylla]|uniref:Uncharacterized protein n=1 Tax=Flemingia macrophylla TaxID=520843 RepID=A0ABD1MRH8_9FABA